jgi:hypothetical protein
MYRKGQCLSGSEWGTQTLEGLWASTIKKTAWIYSEGTMHSLSEEAVRIPLLTIFLIRSTPKSTSVQVDHDFTAIKINQPSL